MKSRVLGTFDGETGYEILVVANGEADYYDKVMLIAEIEHVYDSTDMPENDWSKVRVKKARDLVVKFIDDFVKIKAEEG